jgi:hypothetical protein
MNPCKTELPKLGAMACRKLTAIANLQHILRSPMISTSGAKRAAQQLSAVGADVRLKPQRSRTSNAQRRSSSEISESCRVRGERLENWRKDQRGKPHLAVCAERDAEAPAPPSAAAEAESFGDIISPEVPLVLWSDSPARFVWSAGGLEMWRSASSCGGT